MSLIAVDMEIMGIFFCKLKRNFYEQFIIRLLLDLSLIGFNWALISIFPEILCSSLIEAFLLHFFTFCSSICLQRRLLILTNS